MLFVVSPASRDTYPRGVEGAALAPFCALSIVPDMHAATETPEQIQRMHDWAASMGKRWNSEGNLEPIPAEPNPAEVARAEAQAAADRDRVQYIRQAHVARAAKRWGKACNALARVDSEPHPALRSESWGDFVDARRLVEREARELEVILGRAIIHHVAGSDPGDSPPEYDRDRIRPAAVRIGSTLYVVTADPVPTAEGDDENHEPVPIVSRLDVARVVSLD